MPLRPETRAQPWLLPPSLDDLVPPDHPARFVAAFVDALDRAAWHALGVAPDGAPLGAPAYAPRVLLAVWLYGFLSGIRSARKLEAACRDQLPVLWLTGAQRPDHNTLWRFYQAQRAGLRSLLRRTVRTALQVGLVDLAVQAVDGTKLAGNAAKARTYDAAGLTQLLARTEAAIADLEAQNTTDTSASPPRLPPRLADAQRLQAQVQTALAQVTAAEAASAATQREPGRRTARVNLTDADATLQKGRQGYVAGYNAQAVVVGLDPTTAGRGGLLITATEVTPAADDHGQLVPLITASGATLGHTPPTAADGGYHDGPSLAACAAAGWAVAVPESRQRAAADAPPDAPATGVPKSAFGYDADQDVYTCPQGQRLAYTGAKTRPGRPPVRVYQTARGVCAACPLFGRCTTNRHGRTVEAGPHEAVLQQQRAWMATTRAQQLYARRKQLVEPVFGLLKEHHGARRRLLRGLAAVQAEWALLATAFNLKTLWAVWRGWPPERRGVLVAPGTSA